MILSKAQLEQVQEIVKEYGQHELELYNKVNDRFFDRWWDHQDTMPFRQTVK